MGIIDEHENLGWCHIYAQHHHHSEARIEGTRSALIAIRDAIDKALNSGMDAVASGLITADGEGYGLKVSIRNYDYLDGAILPYTSHWGGGVGQIEFEYGLAEEENQEEYLAEHYEAHNS